MTECLCLTCKHNAYRDLSYDDWIDCVHPVTIAKAPRWEQGDPEWVNRMTGDARADEEPPITKCPTWEPLP